MGNNWIDVSLADISDRIGDGLHGTPQYCEDGEYYFINGNNLENGLVTIKDSTKRVSLEEYLKHKKELANNTILVSINGTIGNVALYNGEDVVLGKSACYINLKDGVSKYFVKYVLSSSLFQDYIHRCSTGSTIKNVSLKMMRDFRFSMPENEAEQLEFVQPIISVDNKITLNRQINQTLEQMAQTLFKSWFVDFDPVVDNALDAGFFEQDLAFPDELLSRAEARKAVREHGDFKPLPDATRQLFPSAFEECAEPSLGLGGWVPQGWCVSTVAKRFKLTNGFPFKSENYVNGGEFGIVTIKNVQDGNFVNVCSNTINAIPNKMNEDCNISAGDVLMSLTGNVGRVCLTGSGKYLLNQRVVKIKAECGVGNAFVYAFFRDRRFFERMLTIAKGTAQQNLSPIETGALLITLPDKDILSKVSNFFDANYIKYLSLMEESNSLTSLRDTLLPKLISGEPRLDEITADLTKVSVA